jgi:hypothetical protein
VLPSKSRKCSPLAEGRKEVISTTITLQGVTYPAHPSLRNTAGAPEKITQNPNRRGTKD